MVSNGQHSHSLPPSYLGVLFEQAPTPFLVVSAAHPAFMIVAVNDAYLAAFQMRREELLNCPWLTSFPEKTFPAPEQSDTVLASFRKVLATYASQEASLVVPAGHAWRVLHTPICSPGGTLQFILQSIQHNHRDLSERNAFLVKLDDSMRLLTEPREILLSAARLLGEHLGADRCAYGAFLDDRQTFQAVAQYVKDGVASLDGSYTIDQFGSAIAGNVRSNQPYMVNDVETDPKMADVRQSYIDAGIRAVAGTPLFRAGRLVAIMGVQQHQTPRIWLSEELELLRLVTARCWESVERAQAIQQLRASEERLRLSQRAARIGGFEWNIKDNGVVWTPELEALFDLPAGGLGTDLQPLSRCVVKEDAERVCTLVEDCISRHQSDLSYDFRAILPDGRLRWMHAQARLLFDEAGAVQRMVGVNVDVDEQKRNEISLRQSEQRLRAIFDGTYEHIGLLSPDGKLLEANRASLEFTGQTAAEVIGFPFHDCAWFELTPGAPEIVKNAIAKAAAGDFVRFEMRLRRPSGEWNTFDLSLHPVRNESGEVVLIVPEGRDITERKLMEERLRQQFRLFDTALSHSPDLIYTFDLDGRFTYANKRLIAISQRDLQDTLGRTVSELDYPPDLTLRVGSQLAEVIKTRENVTDQTALTLPTGEIRQYEYIFVPVLDENGAVRAVFGSTRDITERKESEERLRESEKRFRQLFDSLPQLVWSSTKEGYDDLYNKQWFEYTGLTYEETHGEGAVIIHPDDLPRATELWKHSLSTGEPYEIEYRCRRFDGTYRWFLGRAKPIFDEAGNVVRWFGTCTDIDTQKESEAALRKANRELEEFSYVASHDLQEPLRMVNVYTQLILKALNTDDPKLKQFSVFVERGVSRMEALIQDLLTYSRTTHDRELPIGTASLMDAFQEAESVLKTEIELSQTVIHIEPLPPVRGDAAQLAHVFQNILSNAIKYGKRDESPVIRISAAHRENGVVVSIEDNGIGFDPKYAGRIFGLFKRLHTSEYPGTGLGLAICQRIVERFGGRIWAESTRGVGSTFRFFLLRPDEP